MKQETRKCRSSTWALGPRLLLLNESHLQSHGNQNLASNITQRSGPTILCTRFIINPLTIILFLLQLDYFSSLLQFVFSFDIYLVSIITRRCSGLWGYCNKQESFLNVMSLTLYRKRQKQNHKQDKFIKKRNSVV